MKKGDGHIKKFKMDSEGKKEFEKVWEKISQLEKKENIKLKDKERTNERKKSLRELFLEFNLKSDPEKTLFIMYAGEDLEGVFEFSTKEIKKGFQEIREKVPQNIADKFQTLHKAGFIMPTEKSEEKGNKQKFWQITNSGLNFLKSKKNE
jgi:DNA-binding PadR family transcriptional regulator